MLKGKRALVTGSGRGIGKVIAATLAQAGADLALLDVNSEWLVHAKEELLHSHDVTIQTYVADITDSSQVKAAFSAMDIQMGEVDILVNCAGVGCYSMLSNMPDDEWTRTININLTGAFFCAREAVKRMEKKKWGRVINISSLASKRISVFGGGAYTASKAGLNGFTRHLAFEEAPYGITVNAICPGETLTELTGKSLSPDMLRKRERMSPSGKLCTPQDHANLVVFLSSDGASMINGQCIDVDGGSQLSWMDSEDYYSVRKRNL